MKAMSAGLVIGTILLAGCEPAIGPRSNYIGKPAPEIVGSDMDGTPFRLSDYRGQVVMLDFWGDW